MHLKQSILNQIRFRDSPWLTQRYRSGVVADLVGSSRYEVGGNTCLLLAVGDLKVGCLLNERKKVSGEEA